MDERLQRDLQPGRSRNKRMILLPLPTVRRGERGPDDDVRMNEEFMNFALEHQRLLTRRQLLGRTSAGIGTAALATLLKPELLSAAPNASASPGFGAAMKALQFAPKAKRVIYL